MEGKLFRIKVTQAEMYDLGKINNINHYVLYDSGARVAVDITAEVNQAPLLSKVQPYSVVSDTSIIEAYLSGAKKPIKDWKKVGCFPCITGFKAEELVGDKYIPVRQSMVRLRDTQKALNDRVGEMRKHCLATNLVKPQEEREY